MKTNRFRSRRRARARRCRSLRGSAALFRRSSGFEGLELRALLSAGSLLSDDALFASGEDAHATPVAAMSITSLLASNLGAGSSSTASSSSSSSASAADEAPAPVPLALASQEEEEDGEPLVDPLVEGTLVDVFVRFEDLNGSEITSVAVGQQFRLLVFVDDVRTETTIKGEGGQNLFGVFAAYVHTSFDEGLISIVPDTLAVSDFFDAFDVRTDDSTAGEVRAGGGTLEFEEVPGSDPQLLYSVTLQANSAGMATFSPAFEEFQEDAPDTAQWLMYGEPDVLTSENVSTNSANLTIAGGPDLSIADVTAQETDQNQEFVFTLTLSEASSQAITVDFTTADGTATAGEDYVAASGTLTFAPNQTVHAITVTVLGDDVLEDDETFSVVLSSPIGATLLDDTGTGTIENDDLPQVGITGASQLEGDEENTMVFTVTLSNESSTEVVVPYAIQSGTATAGTDFQAATGTVTFAAGSTEAQLITVTINGDTDPEENETFQVVLTEPANADFDESAGMATGTLLNDDGPHISFVNNQVTQLETSTQFVFTVTIGEAGVDPVTVVFSTMDGTAAAGADYTATSGTLTFTGETITQAITVTVNNDDLNEADETFLLVLSEAENATFIETTATGTIENDDPLPSLSVDDVSADEGTELVFTVSLSEPSGQQVVVQYETVDGTAVAGSDYEAASGALTFAPGQTEQLVTVLVTTDALFEPDETFELRLFDATNVSNTEDVTATGTIENDDLPTLSIEDRLQNEGDEGTTPFFFTVTLSAPSDETVTVSFFTLDGTATTGDNDYFDESGTLTFAPGATTRVITIQVSGDTRDEGDETFTVNLSLTSGATIERGVGTGTIVDDESLPTISISDVTQAEGDAGTTPFVFTVSLSRAAGAPVTVAFATQDGTATAGSDYTAASGTLTFAPGTTSQALTVFVTGDNIAEADEAFSVVLSNAQSAMISDSTGVGTIQSEATDEVANLPSSISGKVFVDANGDGVHSGREKGLAGIQVLLIGDSEMTTTTGPDGSYSFNNLMPGTYTVAFGQPEQYELGQVVVGTQGGTPQSADSFTFTIEEPGGIMGTGNHFTTSRLLSEFISQRLFLASSLGATSPPVGDVSVAINAVTDPITSSNAVNTSISGTGTAGASVSVVATDGTNSTGAFSTTVDADGNWSIAGINVSSLADGTIDYMVTATGTGGATATASITANKDAAAPAVSIGSVTNPIHANNDNDTSISGTGEQGASISVTVSDGTDTTGPFTTMVAADGTWSISGIDVSGLDDGTLTYTATATDGVGNSASTSMAVVKDTESPTVEVGMVVPDPINADNQNNVTINGTGEQGASISVTVSDGTDTTGPFTTMVAADGTWSISDIDVSGLDDGTLTFTVTATDEATNTTTISVMAEKDTVAPTPEITSTASDPTDTSPIPISVDFGEAVTGFTIDDLVVSGGTVDNFQSLGDGLFTFDVTPEADGTITVDIAAGAAEDTAGNESLAATQFSIDFESAPTPEIASTASDPTNTSPIPITVDFGEEVTGFTIDDLVVGGGTADNFQSLGGGMFTFDVTPDADGTITVDIAAGAAEDTSGNESLAAMQFTITFDSTAPMPAITSTASDPTDTSPIPIMVDFGEEVTGFTIDDLVIGGGTADNFQSLGSGMFSFDVTPDADGTITVDIAAAAAEDTAGNESLAATQFSIVFDAAPTPEITSTASDPTNTSPIPTMVDFGEEVTGFTVDDLVVSGGTADNFQSLGGGMFTFDVTPDADGTITVDIAAGAAQDNGGNESLAAMQFTITFDSTAPTPEITSTASDPTDTSPIPIMVDFGEEVTGFTIDDLVIGGGTADNFQSLGGGTFTFDVTPDADGTITVDIDAAAAEDTAGNESLAAAQFSIVLDTAPLPEITSTASDPTNTSPIPMTVDFGEEVTGFTVDDLVIGGGAADNFQSLGGGMFTFDVTPDDDGTITVDIAAAAAEDTTGNESLAATQFTITFDSTAPMPAITSTASDPTDASPIPIMVDFGEEVTGFTIDDLVVSGGTADNFQSLGGGTFTFDVTPDADGTITVDIDAAAAEDTAGNESLAAAQFSIVFDTAPLPEITSTASDPTNTSPIPMTVDFGEEVTGFTVDDLVIGGGAADNFQSLGGGVFTFDLTPDDDGTITVDIAAAAAEDTTGNESLAATQFTIAFDSTAPTPEITSTASDPTDASPIPIMVDFGEEVTGFTIDDLVIGGGAADNFQSLGGGTFSFDVTPDADGTITVDIAAAAAEDTAGNESLAAAQFSIVFDTAPLPEITSTASDPTNTSPIPMTVDFGEEVTGFTVDDLVIGGGAADNFQSLGGGVFTFDVTPDDDGTITVDIAAAAAEDTTGNESLAATQFTIAFDSTAPTPEITSTASDPTDASPIPIMVDFGEEVTGFTIDDLVIGGGTADNFQSLGGGTFTFDVTPDADGTITVDIDAAAAEDTAGNESLAATQFSIEFETPPPPAPSTAGEDDDDEVVGRGGDGTVDRERRSGRDRRGAGAGRRLDAVIGVRASRG